MATITVVDGPTRTGPDNDDRLYEVLHGQRVEKPVGASEVLMANLIAFAINQLVFPNRRGIAIVEILLDIGHPEGDQFRPDLVYVSAERWPFGRKVPPGPAWAVVPDLAVEVISPSNTADEIQSKIEIYRRAGVRLVWVVYPRQGCVYVHDGSATVRVVGREGELDGKPVLDDFRLPLTDLFGDGADPAASS